jgi:hypothetical protein
MVLSVQGGLHYASLQDVGAKLEVVRRDGTGSYRVDATLRGGSVNGVVRVDESPNGLVAGLLGLNDIGPIMLSAQASGARGANQVDITLDAGELHAVANGTIDLPAEQAALAFTAHAPAMALAMFLMVEMGYFTERVLATCIGLTQDPSERGRTPRSLRRTCSLIAASSPSRGQTEPSRKRSDGTPSRFARSRWSRRCTTT